MPGNSINFSRWLERLGFKDGREPEIIRAIQPVQVVQDVSGLLPPSSGPAGVVGGNRNAIAGQFSAFEVFGGTHGGIACSVTIANNTLVGDFEIRYQAAPFVMGALLPITPYDWFPGRSAQFRMGTIAAAFGNNDPQTRALANTQAPLDYYVPPGQWACLITNAATTGIVVYCVWQEYAAPKAP